MAQPPNDRDCKIWYYRNQMNTAVRNSLGNNGKHNAFIDSVNILARVLNSDGIETPWREQLGNQRKRIGDFACFVSYIVGINNR